MIILQFKINTACYLYDLKLKFQAIKIVLSSEISIMKNNSSFDTCFTVDLKTIWSCTKFITDVVST